jgi:hypothetical protein
LADVHDLGVVSFLLVLVLYLLPINSTDFLKGRKSLLTMFNVTIFNIPLPFLLLLLEVIGKPE